MVLRKTQNFAAKAGPGSSAKTIEASRRVHQQKPEPEHFLICRIGPATQTILQKKNVSQADPNQPLDLPVEAPELTKRALFGGARVRATPRVVHANRHFVQEHRPSEPCAFVLRLFPVSRSRFQSRVGVLCTFSSRVRRCAQEFRNGAAEKPGPLAGAARVRNYFSGGYWRRRR